VITNHKTQLPLTVYFGIRSDASASFLEQLY